MMKSAGAVGLILSMLTCAAALTGQSQGVGSKTQEELAELRDLKLKAGFLKELPWTTSFGAAKKAAKAGRKLILAYFTRSFAPSPASQHIED